MTTEFFIFSAVVMGTCLLGLPPKSLQKRRQHEKYIKWNSRHKDTYLDHIYHLSFRKLVLST